MVPVGGAGCNHQVPGYQAPGYQVPSYQVPRYQVPQIPGTRLPGTLRLRIPSQLHLLNGGAK